MSQCILWMKKHHILHSWDQWKRFTATRTPIIAGLPISTCAIQVSGQQRTCTKCGLVQNILD